MIGSEKPDTTGPGSLDERRLRIEETRLALEYSFARKWLPTLATLMVGLIAGMFSYVQQHAATEETARARIDAEAKDKREWGFKIVDMYFNKRDLFDLTKSPDAAESNLRVLVAVAPDAVQGVLNAERSRIPGPSSVDDTGRTTSLAAVAAIQSALSAANPGKHLAASETNPSGFTVYVQYKTGTVNGKEAALRAQSELLKLGYHVPGIQQVQAVPQNLEVRYYHPDQKPVASALLGAMKTALALPVNGDVRLFQGSKPLPGGILELWIPQDDQK
jgi:hypothetical protein